MNFRGKLFFCGLLVILAGCQPSVSNVVGPSSTGLNVGITAVGSDAGLPADGASKATIRVEVFRSGGELVNDASVTLSTTRGTLASSTLTTKNGAAATTLTSSTVPGTAYVVATVESVSATVVVQIVNISTKAS